MKKYLLFLLTLFFSMVSFAEGTGTVDDPVVLTESGSITLPSTGWGHYYFKYTADMDGDVVFSTSEWHEFAMAIYPTEAVYDNASYTDKSFAVTTNTTYVFDLFMYLDEEARFKVTLPHVVKEGDLENPFDVTAGSIDLGSAAGTVWATYTPSASGKATFAGNSGIVTGIKVFSSKEDVNYYYLYQSDYYVQAAAEGNTITVDVAPENTYYVAITKISSPMGNDFKATFAEYQIGDTKDMPVDATALPYETTVAPGGKVWFKVGTSNVGEYKCLTIETNENAALTYGYLAEYYGEYFWCEMSSFTGSNTLEIGNDWYDSIHLVYVENPTSDEINVKFNITEIEEGAVKKSAIDINNTLPYEGTVAAGATKWVWLTVPYDKTKDISVVSADNVEISMEDYYAERIASGTGSVATTCKAIWGNEDIYVKVSNPGATDVTFTVTMEDHVMGPGETKELAIDVTETGIYTFDASSKEVWLKYTAAEDGTIKVSSDLEVNFNDDVWVGTTEMNYINSNNGNKYEECMDVTAGTTIYVHAKISNVDAMGKSFTIAPFVPGEGEVASSAIPVYNNVEFTVPAGKTYYYSFEALKEGWTITIYTTSTGLSSLLWNCGVDNMEWTNPLNISFTDWGDGQGPICTPYVALGTNIFKVYNYRDEDATLKISGDITEAPQPDGIDTVLAGTFQKDAKVLSNGQVVIVKGGKTYTTTGVRK